MSFDLYLQTFRDGSASGIALDIVRDAFGKYVVEVDEDFWQVQYGPEDSSDIFLQPLGDKAFLIHTISIHRPCRDMRLWESRYLLLGLPGAIAYYPGCKSPLVRDPQAGMEMPAQLRESLGEPVMVNDAMDVFQSIEGI